MEISDLILYCINYQTKPLTEKQVQGIEWANFLKQVHYHRVFPLVENSLSQLGLHYFPKPVVAVLEESSNSNRRKLLRLNFEVSKIRKFLSEHEIQAIFYKGPTLAQLAYNSPYLRAFDDLDILVHKEDYLKPKTILAPCGYVSPDFPTMSVEQADSFRHYAGEYSLVNPKGTICLDIHSRLLGGGSIGFSKQFDHVWERVVETQCAAGTVLTLSPEDLLLYLCLNGLKDGWESLRAICDIDRLIRNSEDIDWNFILEEAKELRLERALRLGLLISVSFLRTPLPSGLSIFLEQDPFAASLNDRVCKQIRSQIDHAHKPGPARNFILIFQTLDNWQDKLNYLRGIPTRFYRLLTTVNYRDSEVIKLPKQLHYLYYPIRVARVLLQYQLDIVKIIFK